MEKQIGFYKSREVKSPERGTPRSAGIDFFVPKINKSFIKDFEEKNREALVRIHNNTIIIEPYERVLIPSGIHVRIPKNYFLVAKNKSGISTKLGLDRLAELIDEDYEGEVHISLYNTSEEAVWLKENQKVIQFVLIETEYLNLKEYKTKDLLYYNSQSQRGEGGFGSTGN